MPRRAARRRPRSPKVSRCPICAATPPKGARFCPSCGTALEDRREATQRKVVTTLFADLVGFTALGERHDPEDIDTALRAYYALARTLIERFGGVVEKFIGDAVVGVFGIPKAHEDDAERAVRAALQLIAHLPELPRIGEEELRVRCAVNTGPVLARLHARPETGEGVLVGDAVNTAARLLTGTEPMTTVAGAATHKLTWRAIGYERLPDLSVKGKTEPLERYLATGAVSRSGLDTDFGREVDMIGREVELALLNGLLDKAIAATSPQFVLIQGEAGIGKSRLLREVFKAIDERPGLLCTWRQSRCPAYGEHLTYWPLRDIVSSHAGFLQSDEPGEIEQRLARVLPPGTQNEWIISRLRPLIGLPAAHSDREQLFAAWTRFIELIASKRPAVLVIEDLHWASEQVLDFLDHLAVHAHGVSLLVVGTTRPELMDAWHTAHGFLEAATVIQLKALPTSDAVRLANLLSTSAELPHIAREVAERCGGNPLFAEELTRYLEETGQASASVGSDAVPRSPETTLALIAARLDSLPGPLRDALLDAAVIGDVFRTDTVAAVSGLTTTEMCRLLDVLEEREFVRCLLKPHSPEEREYSFWHALTRDVAYGSLPRSIRATKHARVADWIERDANAPLLDRVALLADHRVLAHDLARAAGLEELAREQLQPAVAALLAAGDQTMSLDAESAERRYAKAAELEPVDGTRRGVVMRKWGKALMCVADLPASIRVFEEALAVLRDRGDMRNIALTIDDYASALCLVGDMVSAVDLHQEWLRALEKEPASPEVLTFLASWASTCNETVDLDSGLPAANRALAMAAELGLDEPVTALQLKAYSRCLSGDREGLEDFERALAVALRGGDTREIGAITYNYCICLAQFDGPAASLRRRRDGLDFAVKRHDRAISYSLRYGIVHDLYLCGQWAEMSGEIEELEPLLEAAGNLGELGYVRCLATHLLCETGRRREAERYADELMALGSGRGEIGLRSTAMVAAAGLLQCQGDDSSCARLLEDCLSLPDLRNELSFDWLLPCVMRLAAGRGDDRLLALVAPWTTTTRPLSAAVTPVLLGLGAELKGDVQSAQEQYAAAAASWSALGVPFEAAQARLAWARCALEQDQPGQAGEALAGAVDVLEALGAQAALHEARRLVASLQPLA